MKRLIPLLVVCLLLVGCSEQKLPNQKPKTSKNGKIEVFFYYSPNCPACRMVEPYMNLLKEKVRDVRFYFCNVNDLKNCSKESIAVARMYRFRYIPTVIVLAGNVTELTGCYEVLRLGEILESYGIKTPNVVFENVSYSVEECIKCHEEKRIPPPSSFNCSYCCHRVQE